MRSTPRGVKSFFYEDATTLRSAKKSLVNLFESWGYTRVYTPSIELLDELDRFHETDEFKKIISFTDSGGLGETLALRYDVTPQIARFAANRSIGRGCSDSLRFAYIEPVYRSTAYGSASKMETIQAGVELIGRSDDPGADAELIALADESMERLSGADRVIVIGSAQYLRAVLAPIDAIDDGGALCRETIAALEKKNQSKLAELAERIGRSDRAAREAIEVCATLSSLSQSESDRAALEEAPVRNERERAPIERLKKVDRLARDLGARSRIIYDLTLSRAINYYHGFIFETFLEGLSSPAALGGRYARSFGEARAYGAGFAIDLDSIIDRSLSASAPSESTPAWVSAEVLICHSVSAALEPTARLARALRARGYRCALDISEAGERDPIIERAKRNGASRALSVDAQGRARLIKMTRDNARSKSEQIGQIDQVDTDAICARILEGMENEEN